MWIWQLKDWPNFTYDKTIVIPKLESCIQLAFGKRTN
ncbi:DUF4172 domain-containing protein [Shewanella eurypsychrophilus]|uniref:DUF4172 domain-containing protein n=1 Tax=Shewanella eurypsychrophilus TaxID=2593656 RepID=A0ABX6V2S2_9GAMM|nr:DUF4172 domain-containing protein [Shewanella sp. YLB-09]QFU21293.1 DUF4172 domain-containing protein [Shewanella sp. YLB-09]QPG56583.1 DUF4172 domain-containing protein [Shewanella eurypsychrophilus]QPG56584.1 DUF4172 domain-containing protein [Shewanella eurypsychrophilus]